MKLWFKIYLLCSVFFVLALGMASVFIAEYSFNDGLKSEIDRASTEIKQLNGTIYSCLAEKLERQAFSINSGFDILSKQYKTENVVILRIITEYINLPGVNSIIIDIINNEGQLLSANHVYVWKTAGDVLRTGSNDICSYTLKKQFGSYFLISSSELIDNINLNTTKDISYIYKQRANNYRFFLNTLVVGLFLLSLIVPLASQHITKPIKKLIEVADRISKGNYSERIDIVSSDEIGTLARQFDNMALDIQKKIEELKCLNESKQKFIDNLVHELRTPMTSVIGYSEYLMNTKYDEAAYVKGLSYINSEGKRVLELSNKLLDVIYLGKHGIDTQPYNVEQLLVEVAEVMEIKLSTNGMQMSLNIDNIDSYIKMDRELIMGVLINLIDNAINASEEGGIIELGFTSKDGRSCIYVEDCGSGIPQEELDRIFEPFYRVDKARSRKKGGAGLGLSLCSEIIKLHRAEIIISSELSKGTRVEILFNEVN